jgi:ACS family glucarate transporter-like MFS transporter
LNSKAFACRIVALLCAISAIRYIVDSNLGIVAPAMMADLHLDLQQIGQLQSAFLLGYAVCQFPAGILADRFGPRLVLGVSLLAWGTFTVLTAVGQPLAAAVGWGLLPTLLLIRLLLGITVASTYPGAARSLSQWVAPAYRARANAVVIAGIAIGTALTMLVASQLLKVLPWQPVFMLSAAPAFGMAVLWLVCARDGTLPPIVGASRTALQRGHSFGAALRSRNLWLLTASYALQGYTFYVFNKWFFLYLLQERRFTLGDSGLLASAPWLLALVTTPLGGVISDVLVHRFGYPWGRRLWPLFAMTLTGGLVIAGAEATEAGLAVALLTVGQTLMMSVEGAYWASLIEIMPRHAGAGGGILNSGGNLAGVVSPLVTPWLAETFGWGVSFHVAAVLSLVGGLLWLGITPQGAFHNGTNNSKTTAEPGSP